MKYAVVVKNRTCKDFELNRFDTPQEATDYQWLVSQYLRKEAHDNLEVEEVKEVEE